ncbi:LysR family transcriptional regulator [Burkholderia puraquae]|uniref:HTH-type transcriptional regulator PgrR n=1 Tax=Burkholderia puraquae TaxID=1904757 RepID=A0A1X1PQ17_9BURK|nr:LysR family transcriptional regulator [Burkholderia puraquae]ORT89371.1 LysR family transcriptional regulator [Burkholderia puraquae]CAB3746785.1 HTH-type transcriptional regulator PgrR [Burkholderia puraquae]
MNWDNARYFLALARTGTLRAAAARLNVDQATVGRRIAALEDELAARLFLRTPTLYVLTTAGEALLEPAETMEHASLTIERRVMGLDDQLCGSVRIATTDTLGKRFVIPAIARLRHRHPGIDVVCVTSAEIANLTRREADLAIRTLRPESPDLIVRRLGHLETGIYASRGYLAERGEPAPGSAFDGHDLVMYQQPVVPTMWDALCGESTSRGHVMFQTSSTMMLVEAALAGLGVAELPCFRADAEPQLVRLMPQRCNYFDVWLVAHADLYKTARLQAVIEAVVDEFAAAGASPA